MADFNLDDYKKKQEEYWNNKAENQQQKVGERLENRERYGIKLSDDQYKILNGMIANAENPDEEAHKIGLAITYANQTGSSITDCYKNVDSYNEALFGPEKNTSYRSAFTSVMDALSMGANNVRIGQLGTELRRAHRNGDAEKVAALMDEINALKADNELKYDNAPRAWVTNVLKAGAQSLPYTGYIAGAAMFGGFFAGPVGTAAAFGAGTQLMSGQEYIDSIDKGISPEIADPLSIISGGAQSLVETALGQVMSFAGVGLKAAGKEVIGKGLQNAVVDKIAKSVQQRFHFGASKNIATRAILGYLFDLPEEGLEEFVQQVTGDNLQNYAVRKENQKRNDKRTAEEKAIQLDLAAQKITDAVAEDLIAALQEEYPELEEKATRDILKDSLEAFKGGVEGAIALGIFTAAGNTVVDNVNLQRIKDLAQATPSEAAFKAELTKERTDKNGNTYTYADVLRQEDPVKRDQVINEIWENQAAARDEVNYTSVRNIAEINTAEEGYADVEEDEETGEKKIEPVQRNEQGELDAESVVTENEDGTSHLQYRVGTTSKADKNLYGYIDATIDKDDKTITINKFSMDSNREGLRQEVFEQFAANNAGYQIEWNTKGKLANQIKQQLIENNLNGRNNGLTYYKDINDLNDSKVRRDVAKQVRTNIKNIASSQVPAAVAYLENLAKSRGMSLNQYYNKYFDTSIFGTMEEAEQLARENNTTFQGKTGATTWKQIGNDVKAVIYAGENADFSTLVHELAHVWQQALTRDASLGDADAQQLLDKLETAFNVQNHDWRASTFEFKDGVSDSIPRTASEALAYGMQDYLKTGKAFSKDLSELFKQLANFIANSINSLANFIDLSPEIKAVYDEMMKNDSDTILAKAYRDSMKADREIRETEKAAQTKQEAEQQAAAKAAEKDAEEVSFKSESEEAAQETEPTPLEKNMPTPEEVAGEVEKLNETEMDVTSGDVISNVEQYTAEQQVNEELANIVSNATGNIAEDIASTISNENETLAAKEDASIDAADIAKKIDDISFQVMNESLFNTLNQSMFKNQLAAELYAAKNNINKLGGVNVRQARKTIKSLYNWEYKNNQWYLETHDDKIKIDMDAVKPYLYGNNPNAIPLDSFYTDPELYTLIPQLRQLKVSFINDIDQAAALSKVEGKEIVINKARFGTKQNSQINLRNAIIYSLQIMLNEASELTPQKIAYFPNNQEVLARVVVTRSLQKADYRNTTLLDEYDPNFIDFQVIGELGATALDRAENVTVRLDNLEIARQMEKEGKEPLKIRLATGWEKGADGLYKYELNDLLARFDLAGKALDYEKGNPRYVELYRKLMNSFEGGEALTDAEANELSDLQDEANVNYYKKEVKLKDILDYPELYKAYPQLKEMDVIYRKSEDPNTVASYAYGETAEGAPLKFILINDTINEYNSLDFNATLLHEVQHAIQDLEGFAVGGNPETATEAANMVKDAFDVVHFYDEIESKYKENPELYSYNQTAILDDIVKEYRDADALDWLPEQRLMNKAFNYWVRGYGIDNARKIVKDNNLDRRVPHVSQNGLTNYRRLAGEVEARNVQKRINMLENERRNTLLSQTADVNPYDQLVIFEGLEMNSIAEENITSDSFANQIDFQQVTDPEEIARLEAEPTIKVYRAAQIIDGELYPPMSAKVNGKLREPIKLKAWERSDENPDLANDRGMMKLNKGNGKTIEARYNPYFHTSPNMLNDQFSEAQDRDNLVTLEVEIPISELNGENPYWAEKAKDSVGTKEWKAGIIQAQLTGTRTVNLSRWDKPIRIVPNEEVAQNIVKSFNGKRIVMPSNVVPPAVRTELEKLGVPFVETTNKGILKDGENAGKHYSRVYANDSNIDFQTAYHGSAAEFDKFDTEGFGYSGEGSMSFGYGTYITASEKIARDYAHRQALGKAKIEDLWTQTIAENMGPDKTLEEAKQESIANLKKFSTSPKSVQNKIIKQIQAITEDDLKDVIGNRKLYTVDIPDGGFIKWDKDVNSRTVEKVKRELLNEIFSNPDSAYYSYNPKELKDEFDSVFQYVQGQQLYNNVSAYLEGDINASRFLNKIGYMGIDYPAGSIHGNGDNARNFVIFNDKDAKIINRLDFQENGSLYGVHNLSEDALKHVFKMGGLANPSVAVVDKDANFDSFGDISLIAYSSFINKSTGRNEGTFGADIYSPRYPDITKTITDTGKKKLKSIFWAIEDEDLKYQLVKNTEQKIEESRNPSFEYTMLPIAYLAEKGNKDFWQYEKSAYSEEVTDLIKSLGPTPFIETGKDAEIVKEAYRKYLFRDLEEKLEESKDALKKANSDFKQNIIKSNIKTYEVRLKLIQESFESDIDPATGNLYSGVADSFYYKVKRAIESVGKVDIYATERAARELVENDADFQKWAEEKYNAVEVDEKIFNGYTPSGNRRYLTHTLENVSKYMKQEATRGGESFNYGMGSARALVTPKFTTLKQIRDNKDRLTDSETFEKIKDELSTEYDWVTDRLRGSLDDYDAGAYRYAEAIEGGYFNADYVAKEYPDVQLTENEAQRITEFTQALKEMPTEYFETKFNRPVYTEDFGTSFAAAVLPESTDPEIVKKLEAQGMLIFKYNNADDRAAAMKAALTTVNMTRDVLFQTQAELYNDAMQYDNWKDFMEAYTMDFNPEALEDPNYHNQVPADASAQWYQTTWELAHGITPEEATSKTELAEKYENEGPIPTVLDAMFDTDMASKEGMLEDFLLKIYEIRNINFNAPDFLNPADQAEAEYFDKLQQMQDYLNTRLSNVTFNTQATHYAKTGELTEPTRKRLLSLIEGNSREYRALYSEIMEDPTYAVDEEDLPRNYLAKKLRKYRLVSPNTDMERKSIDEISRLAKELSNREIAEKVAKKTLRMDDELSNYVESLNKQINDLQHQYDDLEKETTADYQRIADSEKRKLLKLHEQLLLARSKYNKKNDKITRLIDKGLKISGKYSENVQNYKADYDEIFRKYQDLYTTVDITKEVEAALRRQEDLVTIRENLNAKSDEKNLAAEIKRLRIQLVKRTMRRVPFERIDYESARTIIAIQRMLEPNLFGGVNRWIGTEGPYLRGVISGILTDEDYKNEILRYLDKTAKASQAFVDFKKLLQETKTIADFDKWTNKQRKAAIRYLPKENWIRDLNLKQLAKEREESIDLPIEMIGMERPMKDANGNTVTKKDGTPIMVTTFELKTTPEIESLVKDAVGDAMYNNIVSRPFAEWTTEEMEQLAIRVNQIYTEGRDLLAAKKLAKVQEAEQIRKRIEEAVKNTGIVINDSDTPEEKEKKQAKINKILGLDKALHGTAGDTKNQSRLNRLLHGYSDATVLRVARILDNYAEGENVNELYRKENDCYNTKQRSINNRAKNIQQIMKENGITEQLLNTKVTVHDAVYDQNFEFTVDELLFINAANEDYMDDDTKLAKGEMPGTIDANDDYAATSRNAVMFGNMFSSTFDLQEKEEYAEMDKKQKELIEAGDPAVMQLLALNKLDRTPGTSTYMAKCKGRFMAALLKAKNLEEDNPGLAKLREAVAADYATQYERMNEVSIEVLNSPVHRVKCYVPLVRLESNGDTNENQVKEDLLGTAGVGKEWVNKGMTQHRVKTAPLNQKPVQMGLYKTWAGSVERTEHFIAYTDYVRELNRVYKSRDGQYTRNFIESRYGKGMMEYINSYINEVANPNANRVRTAGDELIRTLRGKTAPAYLAWKASAVIKQGATSPWPYMQFVSPAEYLAASWKCITSGGKLYEAIRDKSVFMNNRVMDPMNDLIKEMAENSKNKFTRTFNKINEKGMAGLEWIDWVCVAPGWYACYLKKFNELNGKNTDVYEATKLRLEEENAYAEVGTSAWKSKDKIEALAMQAMKDDVEQRAVEYADDCTRQCQPSNRSVDIAPLFKNSSEAMKAYLQFQTSLNVIWNNLRYDLPYAVKNKQFLRIAGTVIGYVGAGILMNAIMEGWPHGDDDEPEDVVKQFIWYSTTQFTDSVPMIGSALTTANQKLITGKADYFGTSGTDMTPMVTKFINAATNAGTAIRNAEDEEKAKQAWMKAASNFVDGVNMNVGLPVSGVKEITKLAGVGNKEPGLDLDLGSVYGIVDNITDKDR